MWRDRSSSVLFPKATGRRPRARTPAGPRRAWRRRRGAVPRDRHPDHVAVSGATRCAAARVVSTLWTAPTWALVHGTAELRCPAAALATLSSRPAAAGSSRRAGTRPLPALRRAPAAGDRAIEHTDGAPAEHPPRHGPPCRQQRGKHGGPPHRDTRVGEHTAWQGRRTE